MDNPFQTKEFKILHLEWREKLRESGFVDCENEKAELKQYDRRTNSFEQRAEIQNFFSLLDGYLNETDDIPPLHRKILELYSDGLHQLEIVDQVHRSRTTVQTVIYAYTQLIKNSL